MAYVEVPAKVLECFVRSQIGEGSWPFNDQTNDPFWEFGATPRDYRWLLTIDVKPQYHSSHKTRIPRMYNGMDVKVGDYVASTVDGTSLKIVCITQKTDDVVVCIAEDVFRYNTFRDVAGVGTGIFAVPTEAVIFEVNENNLPVVDPLPPGGVGPAFYPNLMSRFQNLEKLSNFTIHQNNHGFVVGQLVSANHSTHAFSLTDDDHPYLIGTVSFVHGPNDFTISPIQGVVDNLDYLPGLVADTLYADPTHAGQVRTQEGTNPVMIKLRDYTQTVVSGTISAATTAPSAVMTINGVNITVGGSGTLNNFINSINAHTADHGVTASVAPSVTVLRTNVSLLNSTYREVLFKRPNGGFSARINGVVVQFTSSIYGTYRYNDATLGAVEDIARDINAAAITGVVATVDGTALVLTNTLGAGITLENIAPDANGNNFAGSNSITGMVLSAVASPGSYLRMTAVDARAINISNKAGSPLQDFGITSVENGVKAAAIFVEQGIRKATNYVVTDLTSRNALDTIIGDQAYVIDKGDGQWGLFLYTGSSWTVISTAEAAKVDSDTYVANVTYTSTTVSLGRVNGGSKVTSVTFEVIAPFDGNPTISVGDDGQQNRLAGDNDVDLKTVGSYIANPVQVYDGPGDTFLNVYLSSGNATSGLVKVTLTYQ